MLIEVMLFCDESTDFLEADEIYYVFLFAYYSVGENKRNDMLFFFVQDYVRQK